MYRKILLLSVLSLPVLTAAPAAAATDYYVSPSGSDGNSGTSSGSPFATIQKALNTAPTGATIHLASGTYLQDAVTTRPGVTVTGPSTAVVKGGGGPRVIQVQHDDITFDGFTVDGLHGSSSSASGYRDKLIYVMSTTAGDGVDGFTLKNATVKNAGGECLRLRYLITGADVTNNSIGPCGTYDFKFAGGGKNGEGIYIGTAPEQRGLNGAPDSAPDVSRDNHIHGNTIDTQGNECVDVKEDSTANLIENNDCTGQKDANSAGLDSRGNANTFRSNTVYGNTGAGIRFGGDTTAYGRDNDAYDNTITNNASGGIKFQNTPQGIVCGNTMSGNTGGNAVGTYGSQFTPTAACSTTETPLAVSAVTASDDDGNVPANTLDNNLSTRWSAEGSGVWIRYDLGSTRTVTKLAVAWHKGDQRTSDYAVEVSSTGSSWTRVLTATSSGTTTAQVNVDIPDSSARYVRIVGFGNSQNDWTSITEVDIYGA